MVKYRVPLRLAGVRSPRARQELFAHLRLPRDLRRMIGEALAATNSTGCSVWELHQLHSSMLRERPSSAIEFGSGISTLVIAHAVRRLAKNGHVVRFVTMEQGAEYQENMLAWFPDELRPYVDFRLSEVTSEPTEDGLEGYRYTKTPSEQFDWCFVDGPQLPRTDPSLFDADVLSLPKGHRMVVHIDGRRSTRAKLVHDLAPDNVKVFKPHGWATLILEGNPAASRDESPE